MKTFCTFRSIIKGTQGQNTGLKKEFAPNIFDTGVLAGIYKELLKLTNEKTG